MIKKIGIIVGIIAIYVAIILHGKYGDTADTFVAGIAFTLFTVGMLNYYWKLKTK